MGMADVLAKAESPTSLKTIITDILKQEETKEPLDPSNPNHRLSISAIASLCPREEVICGLKKISRVRVIDVGLGTAFKTGHALHEVMQGSILSESPCFLGMWSCLDCGRLHGSYDPESPGDGLIPCPELCSNPECLSNDPSTKRSSWQKQASFMYREVRVEDTDLRVSGRMDGILSIPIYPGFGVFELKSIAQHSAWKIRHVPQAEHVIQCQLYMELTGLKWAIILYWNKGGSGADIFVEHLVEYDPITVLELRSQILSIWKGIRDNLLPDRICATVGCTRAKACDIREQCFNFGNFVPEE